MTIACDFCGSLAERHDEVIFIAAPSELAHICEECVGDYVNAIAAKREQIRIASLCEPAYSRDTARRANPKLKGSTMTTPRNPNHTENTGNETTVHNPKAPGQVEKVDPQTGDTTSEDTNVEKPVNR